MKNIRKNNIMRKDSEWSAIDGDLCKIIEFTPLATIKNGKIIASNKTEPYAFIILECKKLPEQTQGFICHKIDFQHLWAAFKERGVKQDEEVLIIWSKKHYNNKLYAIFTAFLPKLWVMICSKGSFELETNESYKPELTGEARWSVIKPIIDWKPKVME